MHGGDFDKLREIERVTFNFKTLEHTLQCLIKFNDFAFRPDSIYSIRVQAVNSVGCGAFSSTAQLSTKPLPPAPPRCECVNANHNALKLKWGDTKVDLHTVLEFHAYV